MLNFFHLLMSNSADDLFTPGPNHNPLRPGPTPVNAQAIFTAMSAEEQAEFFAEIAAEEDLFDYDDLEEDVSLSEEYAALESAQEGGALTAAKAVGVNSKSKGIITELADLAALFREVQDAASLAQALNAALPWHGKRHPSAMVKAISVRAINYYAYKKQASRYRTFQIAKRTRGEMRSIKAPDEGLLRIQRLLLVCLSAAFGPGDDASHGFVAGRNVLTNAQPHTGRRFVLNLDLKDFFPQTHFGKVVAVLQLPPFKLDKEGAYLVANLCCDEGALPQGAPTSPLLTNAVCQRLDRQLGQLAKQFSCRYTRYADDLTFSSNRHVFTRRFHTTLNAILAREGYEQNLKKQRLQLPNMRQEVTGVVVNDKPSAPRTYVRQIRAMLHNWSKNGYEAATAKLIEGYGESKAHSRHKGRVPKLERVIAGKIAYLGMVKGVDDPIYLQLAHRLALLVSEEYKQTLTLLELLRRTEEFL
jgi:RNA-directed DNA polymerase